MYSQREIVLVPFPYADLSSSKRRPVLLVSNNDYNKNFPDALVCVVTSNLFKDGYSVTLNDADLESGRLPVESIIKCHKLFTIEQSQILKRFSKVSVTKFGEVKRAIEHLIQTSV